ncbi:MAG TPA: hypothetical protein VN922_21455 [Bacteroidia bacterium]|nr:hypothetical protein [Bacteroidia bacterium]
MKNSNEAKDGKETRPVSFRLPTDVFDALNEKGSKMEMSAHELASKIVQENYQAPIEAIVVNETVTCSKQVFIAPATKQVFHFTRNDLRSIQIALGGGDSLPCHLHTMRMGDEWKGLTRIGENLYEVAVEPCHAQFI